MCTALSVSARHHYFGRNLDLEYSYNEYVTVTPRRYPFLFADGTLCDCHGGIIGMAAVVGGYPLYFDATNEAGLSVAGLNFPHYAYFPPPQGQKMELAPYEVIPGVLCTCSTVTQAVELLEQCRVADLPFSEELPVSPLHWLIADRERAVAVEPVKEGLKLHQDPVGVLTNSPPFPMQMVNLCNYRGLSATSVEEHLTGAPEPYSKGMGAMGLPGDLSSMSRFVRAVFTRQNALFGEEQRDGVGQFFHILDTVAQVQGCNRTADGEEITRYSSCCDTDEGIYYYTTYGNRQITAVDMKKVPLDGREPVMFPLEKEQNICWQTL